MGTNPLSTPSSPPSPATTPPQTKKPPARTYVREDGGQVPAFEDLFGMCGPWSERVRALEIRRCWKRVDLGEVKVIVEKEWRQRM
jgi:hypothetical protein